MGFFRRTLRLMGAASVVIIIWIIASSFNFAPYRDIKLRSKPHVSTCKDGWLDCPPPKTVSSAPRPSTLAPSPDLYIPLIQVQGANCAAIAASNDTALQEAYAFMGNHTKVQVTAQNYTDWASDCPSFLQRRGYIRSSLTEDEAAFPLAFSLLIYKDVEQFERLLRAIYRPQNVYCVHVDKKSDPKIKQAAEAISQCFDNVVLSSEQREVRWGGFTNLEPEILCMRDLWKYTWKYFINLTGQEWPLKTNWHIVQTLKLLNGGNLIAGFPNQHNWDGRWNKKVPQFYANISMTKGAVHIVASRAYVDYVLHNQIAVDFLSWVNGTSHPDETFFNSLHFSPQLGVPGAYNGPRNITVGGVSRYKQWVYSKHSKLCKGKVSKAICVLGVGDLPVILDHQRPPLFANKFHLTFEPLGLDCMEQLLFDRVRQETAGHREFNASVYSGLGNFMYHM